MEIRIFKKLKGSSLLETVIAYGIVVFVVLSLFTYMARISGDFPSGSRQRISLILENEVTSVDMRTLSSGYTKEIEGFVLECRLSEYDDQKPLSLVTFLVYSKQGEMKMQRKFIVEREL